MEGEIAPVVVLRMKCHGFKTGTWGAHGIQHVCSSSTLTLCNLTLNGVFFQELLRVVGFFFFTP